MSYLSEVFATFFGRIGLEKYVIPVVETPNGTAKNLQANANGELLVDIAGLAEGDLATSAKQDTGNTSLAAISGKLPATLGAKTSAASLSIAMPTDLQPFKIEVPGPAMTTLRTLSGATADTEPPTDGSTWIAMPGAAYSGLLEIPIAGAFTAVGGTVAPTLVTMRVWSRLGSGGAISKVYEETFQASWLTTGIATNPYRPRYIPFNAPDAIVTFTFPDGTAPTITGTVKGRMVTEGSLTSKDFPRDPATGNVVFQGANYDAATQTDKVSDAYKACDLYLNEPLVVNEASKANGDYYGPSDAGLIVGEHGEVSVSFSVTGANGGTVTITVEATNQETWASPIDITKSVWESKAGALITAGSIATAANGTQTGILCLGSGSSPCNYRMIRVKYVVAGGASGAISMSFRRKVRS